MNPFLEIIRPSSGGADSFPPNPASGVYACSEELRNRWGEQDEEGNSRLERVLERIRSGAIDPEEIVDLRGASLLDVELAGVELGGADLRGADLSRADLRGAHLFQADLRGTVLFAANLDGADLTGANLHGANLDTATLRGASLGAADLSSAMLTDATLDEATLSRANLSGAMLRGASLRAVSLLDAKLQGANFAHTDLRGCSLNRCDVTGACFDEADMRSAHLHRLKGYEQAQWLGADLREVDFAGAHMTRRFITDQNYIHEFRSQSATTNLVYHVWALTSDCGRSMARWITCTLVIAALFAALFMLVDVNYGASPTWYSPFYFSVVTLTSLGFGDVLPVSVAAQMVATAEVCIGYLMLGGIISILSNKLARRAD